MCSSDFLIEDGVLTKYNGPGGSAAEQYVRENPDRIKFEAL